MSTATLVKKRSGLSPNNGVVDSEPRASETPTPIVTDRRFADPAWQSVPWSTLVELWRGWATATETLAASVPAGEFAPMVKMNVKLLTDMLAPSNAIATNPVALKHAIDTGGLSILAAACNFTTDQLSGGILPALATTTPFVVGETVALTPGSVVYRDARMEVLHYRAQTSTVNAEPVLFVPPQINRYYVIDIQPGRSLIEYMVQHGLDVYCVVWRNPQLFIPGAANWDFEWYIRGTLDAIQFVKQLSGSPRLDIMGACASGITLLEALSHLATQRDDCINAVALVVTMVDTTANADGPMGQMMPPTLMKIAPPLLDLIGVVPGISDAIGFRVAQPSQTLWPQWINQWVLGNPPANDALLAWNVDTTNISAGFVKDMVQLVSTNGLMNGTARVFGKPVKLNQITAPTLLVSGKTDNVTPWKGSYAAVHVLGGTVEYIHTPTGHVQSVVFPPSDPRCNYLTSDPRQPYPANADDWKASAATVRASWWPRLVEFFGEHRSGTVPAIDRATTIEIDAAPGRYARE